MIIESPKPKVFDTSITAFRKDIPEYQQELIDWLHAADNAYTIPGCYDEAERFHDPNNALEVALLDEFDFAGYEIPPEKMPHRDELVEFVIPHMRRFGVSTKDPYTHPDVFLAAFALELSKDEEVDFLSADIKLSACLQYLSMFPLNPALPIATQGVTVHTFVQEDQLFYPIFDLHPPNGLVELYDTLGIVSRA